MHDLEGHSRSSEFPIFDIGHISFPMQQRLYIDRFQYVTTFTGYVLHVILKRPSVKVSIRQLKLQATRVRAL